MRDGLPQVVGSVSSKPSTSGASGASREETGGTHPGVRSLAEAAKRHKVELLTSSMGLTGAVNIGPGALSIGMIVDDPAFTTE